MRCREINASMKLTAVLWYLLCPENKFELVMKRKRLVRSTSFILEALGNQILLTKVPLCHVRSPTNYAVITLDIWSHLKEASAHSAHASSCCSQMSSATTVDSSLLYKSKFYQPSFSLNDKEICVDGLRSSLNLDTPHQYFQIFMRLQRCSKIIIVFSRSSSKDLFEKLDLLFIWIQCASLVPRWLFAIDT